MGLDTTPLQGVKENHVLWACHSHPSLRFRRSSLNHSFDTEIKLRLLRIFLGLAAVTWGAATPGVFLSWDAATAAMEGLGAKALEYDKMLDYWLRMAAGGFGLIGCLYLLPAIQPRRFQEFIPWLGLLAIVEGVILLFHGLRLALDPWPFLGDVAACLVAACGILFCWFGVRSDLSRGRVEPIVEPVATARG